MIGVLQAIEVIKILTGIGSTMHDQMLMYDALQCCFLRVKKSGKRKTCAVCGPDAWIKCMEDSLRVSLVDSIDAPTHVVKQAGFPLNKEGNSAKSTSSTLPTISCFDYFKLIVKGDAHHVLLDVRVSQQYAIVSLKDSVNIPLESLHIMLAEVERLSEGKKAVYCICRRGIASSEATRIIMDGIASGKYPYIHSVINITGGLIAWAKEVDKDFPLY
jgi:adenylyltransferase/sulfurtransferase